MGRPTSSTFTPEVAASGGSGASVRGLLVLTEVAWAVLVASSLVFSLHENAAGVRDLALQKARATMTRDMAYRRWVADKGGVYVAASEATPPNPYLAHLADRDVDTTDGRRLTLVNPAYMTRQVQELAKRLYGTESHITSRKPLRPENKADPWEEQALAAVEAGAAEVFEEGVIDGVPHYRYMGGLRTEASCLKCHASQGYQEGDVRGGISVSLVTTPYDRLRDENARNTLLGHLALLGVGLAGLWLGARSIRRRMEERDRARDALAREQAADRVIGELAFGLVSPVSPEEMAVRVLGAASRLVESPDGIVGHRDLDSGTLRCVAVAQAGQVSGRNNPDAPEPPLSGLLRDALVAQPGVVVLEDAGDPRWAALGERRTNRCAVAAARAGDNLVGVIAVAGASRPYSDVDKRVLARLADLYAIAALRERDRRLLEWVVTGLAHEVRNPLNAIQVSAEALSADLGANPDHAPFLDSITRHVDRMARLMRDLLQLRRPLARDDVHEVDVVSLVQTAASQWRSFPGHSGRVVRVVVPDTPGPPLRGDPVQLQQVLENLMDNAHQHSPPGLEVVVSVEVRPSSWVLEVRDQGAGVSAVAASRIFHPFFTTRAGGTGLGLVLVRHIAQLHGGSATLANNAPGPGCTARVEIPFQGAGDGVIGVGR